LRLEESPMAKLTDDITTFQTGDLVFTRFPPKGTQPIHVTLFLAPGTGVTERSFVHAGATQLEIAKIADYAEDKDSGGYLRAYPTDTTVRTNTAEVAKLFAQTVKPTPYGAFPGSKDVDDPAKRSPKANRFSGMIKTTSVSEIPFEFAALRRLLKWTMKEAAKAPLSENRGVTCAAFVSICHQVAGMKAFLSETQIYYQPEKFKDAMHKIDALTFTKEQLREKLEVLKPAVKQAKPIYLGQAERANSNRELTPDGIATLKAQSKDVELKKLDKSVIARLKDTDQPVSAIDRYWLTVQTQYLGIPEAQARLLETIVPAGFLFDAKYVSSMALSRRVQDIAGWRNDIYTAY
jgi:hypothetical protein